MDSTLQRLIREHYPFPIAHAHKKTLAELDDNAQKLKCLIQTAEVTIQFLALVMLAQLHHDLEHNQVPALGSRSLHLRDDLRNPSFGKWHGILRDVLKEYRDHRELLVVPELFDCFFAPSRGTKLAMQPLVEQAIDPLITLRNQFHHPRIPDALIPDKVAVGSQWLEQLLSGIQFVQGYDLAFVQRIELRHQGQTALRFSHDLVQMTGCFSTFDRRRWESAMHLREGRLVLLATGANGRSLCLDPFVTVADQLPVPGVLDVFLLNGTEPRRARYLSTQFGQELTTAQDTWPKGAAHLEALGQFFTVLRHTPPHPAEVELEWDGQPPPVPVDERVSQSTEAVYTARYRRPVAARQYMSPYKFLDYFEPEDAELFFGREQEIRQLQQKFHNARLLILHGESGTGKTSLIRAGLIPRLPPESYIPVYVRAWQEPTQAIKEAMRQQLGVDRRHLDLPLVAFLDAETAHLSKTVVVILDQFEEFFLRFPREVRQRFHQELGACMAASHLDVHLLFALREDYFARLAEFQDTIPDIFTHEMSLSRLTPTQAFAAAVEPVKRLDLSIDEALVAEEILPQLNDAAQGIEPPLLQIVCDALYQQAHEAGRTAIGRAEYDALGKVRDVLGRYLERTLRQFGQEQPQARAVLKALVTAEGTKRAMLLEELGLRLRTIGVDVPDATLERDFVRRLVQARLVRAEVVEGRTQAEGRTRYELTHDFLVRQITRWIAQEERELITVLELIDRAYAGYQATGILLERQALKVIAEVEDQLVLSPEHQAFLEQSKRVAHREWWRSLRRVGTVLLLVVLGVGGFSGWQLWQSNQQLQEERDAALISQSRTLAVLSREHTRAGNTTDGILLALQALPRNLATPDRPDRPYVAVAEAALAHAVFHHREKAILEGHEGIVDLAAFSPHGEYLVTISGDTARLWNGETGEFIAILKGHPASKFGVYHIAFSPDSQRLVIAAGDDKTVGIWNTTTGEIITRLEGHEESVKHVAFSPDGQHVVTASYDDREAVWKVRVWDATTGKLSNVEHRPLAGRFATFSPDSQHVVIELSNNTIQVWDVTAGKPLATIYNPQDINFIAFSPEGQRIVTASSQDGMARVWHAETGELMLSLPAENVTYAAFSPDGNYILTDDPCCRHTVRLWNAQSGKLVATMQEHGGTSLVSGTMFSPDSKWVITGSDDGTAKLWKVGQRFSTAVLNHLLENDVSPLAVSPDGKRLVTFSIDLKVRLWDITIGEPSIVLQAPDDAVTSATFSPDGYRIATIHTSGTTRLWDMASSDVIATLPYRPPSITEQDYYQWSISPERVAFSSDSKRGISYSNSLGADILPIQLWDGVSGRSIILQKTECGGILFFSPDGKRIYSECDLKTGTGVGRLWDAETGEPIVTIQSSEDSFRLQATFSPDSRRLVTGSATLRMWNADTGILLATLHGHQDRIASVTFSPDGKRLLTTSDDGTARIWDANTTETLFVLRGHKGKVWNAAFSPDNRRLVTGGDDGTTHLWDANTGESIAVMESHSVRENPNVAFSSDGHRILTQGRIGPVRLWDGRTGERIAQLEHNAFGAVFSPDGKRIVTTGVRQQQLWDAASGAEIASFRVAEAGPHFAEFSPDGRQVLLTTPGRGPARVWQLPPTGQALIDYARRIIPRQRRPE